MTHDETMYIKLTNHKHTLANELLRMTRNLQLTGEKEHADIEAQTYIDFIENRQKLLDELTMVYNKLESAEYKILADSGETKRLNRETEEMIRSAIEQDKKNATLINEIKSSLMKIIKDINISKNASAIYKKDISSDFIRGYDVTK